MTKDKYTVKRVNLFMAENGGWIAIDKDPQSDGYSSKTSGAFTTKKDMMEWLEDNLSYSTSQWEGDHKINKLSEWQ